MSGRQINDKISEPTSVSPAWTATTPRARGSQSRGHTSCMRTQDTRLVENKPERAASGCRRLVHSCPCDLDVPARPVIVVAHRLPQHRWYEYRTSGPGGDTTLSIRGIRAARGCAHGYSLSNVQAQLRVSYAHFTFSMLITFSVRPVTYSTSIAARIPPGHTSPFLSATTPPPYFGLKYGSPTRVLSFTRAFRFCSAILRKDYKHNIGKAPTRRANPQLPRC